MSDAARKIAHGTEFPYHGKQPTDKAETAALAVLADLCDRRGIRHELDGVDTDVREEIVSSLAGILRLVFASEQKALESKQTALEVILRFGGIDGGHHKAWVIDQAVRALTGDGYAAWVEAAKDGEDGPETYSWDEGIAP